MNQERIYLSPPHMGGEEQLYVASVFDSNWIAPLGPMVDQFERELASKAGCAGAVALSSGTAAIHLALRLLDIGPGDRVFCSTLTFVASANPILYVGAEPVFIDSEPDTWNMSPQALERAFEDAARRGKLPRAVVVVHLYGQNADMDPIVAVCERYGVPIVEDAAESLGATYKHTMSGAIGKFGIYSFNGNKIITTSGGGALLSNDLPALEKARYWATQARDAARHYEHSVMGYNYRLSNVLAAIGVGQLAVLSQKVEARRQIFARYEAHLSPMEGIVMMPEAAFGMSTRWLTALTLEPDVYGITAHEVVDHMAQLNIECRPVWKPMHLQPLFKGTDYYEHEEGTSVSDRLFRHGICLPSGSNLTESQQERVIEGIQSMLYALAR
ncbi:aminotransferase class I/II-fold pyridoxal phosphate-dependent enzyme [Paenibacillus sp. ACRRX]|uniref:DegT/DnrJ/EryC1/StrS family aminotransferase n=1 Tax=unclassified Paenibacillus TaxID=185978 RepID=UPI001EF74AF1|nr:MULTISPECIES: aminotransferase class I/II-fold pyridoxal phosphate-dependent enzyme [unclassified Paenibacillus]MCG7408989.1 aminotransferase class I/II-fold pyridoxal phosphate-dependent enzyme [Paenibacillus sp. ACRRX]MDK8182012.1 aminotransferase class I/II-fold pyridoxal phosphate-dependent enzyme [Paenibacillus sp. UMB4589-SE434]